MIELTHRNTRRYGGYLVHMGIVLMFIGWSGHPFNQTAVGEVNKGDTMQVGAYTLKVVDLTEGDTPNYQWETAILEVSKNGKSLGTLEPTRRFYKAAQQATAEVALRSRLNEDLYINYAARVGQQSHAAGLRVPAGRLDLDRRARADLRHAGRAGSEQGGALLSAHRSGRYGKEECAG